MDQPADRTGHDFTGLDLVLWLQGVCQQFGVTSGHWPTEWQASAAAGSYLRSERSELEMRAYLLQHQTATPADIIKLVVRGNSYLPRVLYDAWTKYQDEQPPLQRQPAQPKPLPDGTTDLETYLHRLCDKYAGVYWPEEKLGGYYVVTDSLSSFTRRSKLQDFVDSNPNATPAEVFARVKRCASWLPTFWYDVVHAGQRQTPTGHALEQLRQPIGTVDVTGDKLEQYLCRVCCQHGTPWVWATSYDAYVAVMASRASHHDIRKIIVAQPDASLAKLFEVVQREASHLTFWLFNAVHPRQHLPSGSAAAVAKSNQPIGVQSLFSVSTKDYLDRVTIEYGVPSFWECTSEASWAVKVCLTSTSYERRIRSLVRTRPETSYGELFAIVQRGCSVLPGRLYDKLHPPPSQPLTALQAIKVDKTNLVAAAPDASKPKVPATVLTDADRPASSAQAQLTSTEPDSKSDDESDEHWKLLP